MPAFSRSTAFFEPLENRQLFAGFQLNVDFHPEGAQTADGYVRDVGWSYGERATGYTLGWSNDNRDNAVERNHPFAPNKRFDTFNQILPGENWQAKVPNGSYQVRLLVGDPTDTRGRYIVDVEGQRLVNDLPSVKRRYIDRIGVVNVTDGNLTLTSGLGSGVDKLCSIQITQLSAADTGNTSIDWTTTAAPNARITRVEPGSVQIGDKLYVMGGYTNGDAETTSSVEVLDLETGVWSDAAPLPDGAAQSHAGIATDGERYIYWVAGQKLGAASAGTNTAWRYDTVDNTWSHYVDLPEVRFAGGLAYFNGALYFIGGDDASRSHATSKVWALSTRSKNPSWIDRAELPARNDHLGIAVVDGTIYSFGGEDNHGTTYDQHSGVYAYSPWLNEWSTKASLPLASSHFEGGVHVVGDKVMLIAGRINVSEGTWTDQVRVYDTTTDSWSITTPLPDARLGPSTALYHGRVYVVNGYSATLGMASEGYWGTINGI